jgi:hypothetical protein
MPLVVSNSICIMMSELMKWELNGVFRFDGDVRKMWNFLLWYLFFMENKNMTTGRNILMYEGVSKSFRTGRLERELKMTQLSATRCSFIAILWASLVSFVTITLCVASRRVFVFFFFFFFYFMRWASVRCGSSNFNWEFMSNYNFYGGAVTTQQHNPQPGGPVDYSSSDPYPLTCLAWVTLPGA